MSKHPKRPAPSSTPRRAPTRAQVANALQMLTTAPDIERGETESLSSFRTSKALAEWVKDSSDSVRDESDLKNRAVNTTRLYIEETAPHAALIAVYAEEQGIEPIQAVARLAIECLQNKYPEFAKRLHGKLKK